MKKYLYSTSHLLGSLGALMVIAAYFGNVIGQDWLLLSGGSYLLGAVLGRLFDTSTVTHLADGISTQEALAWLRDEVLPKLPSDAKVILGEIVAKVTELMPRLKLMEQQGIVQAENRALLKQTVVRYLPDAVESYLRLPVQFAKHAKVAGDKTPQTLLCEQLTLLKIHVDELETQLLSSDVNAMLANGQFLQARLQDVIHFKS